MDLLIAKGLILFTELPVDAQQKIMRRQQMRYELGSTLDLIERGLIVYVPHGLPLTRRTPDASASERYTGTSRAIDTQILQGLPFLRH